MGGENSWNASDVFNFPPTIYTAANDSPASRTKADDAYGTVTPKTLSAHAEPDTGTRMGMIVRASGHEKLCCEVDR
jgi:hypothetical protein